jgi:hypothetical protein
MHEPPKWYDANARLGSTRWRKSGIWPAGKAGATTTSGDDPRLAAFDQLQQPLILFRFHGVLPLLVDPLDQDERGG